MTEKLNFVLHQERLEDKRIVLDLSQRGPDTIVLMAKHAGIGEWKTIILFTEKKMIIHYPAVEELQIELNTI